MLELDTSFYPDIVANRDAVLTILSHHATPVFLCEQANLAARHQELSGALQRHWGPYVVAYSFKTNYLVAKSRILQELGAWAEVVSSREYELARELGFEGSRIVFNGPFKPNESLERAMHDEALINLNDHGELDRLLALTDKSSSRVEVGIRLSTDLPRLGHSRFGFSMDTDEAVQALRKIHKSASLELVAVHMNLYGDTDDPDLYRVAAERLGYFVQTQVLTQQASLKFIDMGGGFPAHSPKPKSRSEWSPRPIDIYIQHIANALRPFIKSSEHLPALVVEPGRYLTCDGIMLVTRVVHVKTRDERQMVNCDGSISMVPLTHYAPQVIRGYSSDLQPRQDNIRPTVIHGSTCRENDILYDGAFPSVEPGDYLVHFAAGAYNSSLSPDFIFASPVMKVF